MPPNYLKCANADAEDFSTLDDLIDFSNEDINGGSVDQISRQTCSSTSITTNTHVELGGGRDVSNSALSLQKEQLPAVMQTSLDSNLSEGLCVPWDDFAEIGWLSQSFVNESFSSLIADMATTDLLVGSHDVNLDIHVREESKIKEDVQANIQDERRSYNFQSGSPISVLESSAKAGNGRNNILEVEEEVASSKCIVSTGGGAATLSHVPGRIRSKRKRTEACLWNARVLAASNLEADITTAPSCPPLIQSCNSTSYYDRHAFVYDYGDDEADDDQQEGMAGPGAAAAHPSVKKKLKKIIKTSAATKSKSSTLGANNNHHQARLPAAKKASTAHKIRLPTLGADQGTSKTNCGDDNDRSQISMRKCLHCGSQSTPQWRVGPMGPKTLCNACGVRYKSGRLLPEYRPAASPTFEEALHSNSHRRVLEMHMQKKLASAGADSVARPSLVLGAAHENAAYGLSVHAHHGEAPEHKTTSSSCILMEETITSTNNDMPTSTTQPNSLTVLLPVWAHPKLS